jgi:hypothetical protein
MFEAFFISSLHDFSFDGLDPLCDIHQMFNWDSYQKLLETNSYLCSDMSTQFLDDFHICFYTPDKTEKH